MLDHLLRAAAGLGHIALVDHRLVGQLPHGAGHALVHLVVRPRAQRLVGAGEQGAAVASHHWGVSGDHLLTSLSVVSWSAECN